MHNPSLRGLAFRSGIVALGNLAFQSFLEHGQFLRFLVALCLLAHLLDVLRGISYTISHKKKILNRITGSDSLTYRPPFANPFNTADVSRSSRFIRLKKVQLGELISRRYMTLVTFEL
jgi:hypothetical protein